MQLYKVLGHELGKSKSEISGYAYLAPQKYKIYRIPKRTVGTRTIAHPAKELKEYQRALVSILELILPVHVSAFAYKKNSNIKKNASVHKNSKYLLKMDFQDFFHSITPTVFFDELGRHQIGITQEDGYLLKQLLFINRAKRKNGKLILSIKTPNSPLISNFIMNSFDGFISVYCKGMGINYSRYADDITFSTNQKGLLFSMPEVIKRQLRESFSSNITINESKTVFSSKAHNRHVTGITITNEGTLSIGRARKRYISSMVHKFSLGLLDQNDIWHLKGLLSFATDVEPEFKLRLFKKYTPELIMKIDRWNDG